MEESNIIKTIGIISIILFLIIAGYVLFFQNTRCDKFSLGEKNILGYNETFYGGYNCYEEDDYIDVYFSPQQGKFISGNITYFIRCYDDMPYCLVINKYLEVKIAPLVSLKLRWKK